MNSHIGEEVLGSLELQGKCRALFLRRLENWHSPSNILWQKAMLEGGISRLSTYATQHGIRVIIEENAIIQ